MDRRAQIQEEINALHLYKHTLLSHVPAAISSPSMELQDETDEDCTLTRIAANLHNLGIDGEDDQDDDSEMDGMDDRRRQVDDDDPDWYPHGSKTLGTFLIEDPTIIQVEAARLKYNYLDLVSQSDTPIHFSARGPVANVVMPHPTRKITKGKPAFCLRIMPWADDVSGNCSKQYNAHMNIYIANVNIPHRKLAQEYFVQFCSTSPHASSIEQFTALSEDLKSNEWRSAYDCKLQQEIIFQIHAHLLPADNPQQATESSTASSKARMWCRGDDLGGTDNHRETDEGYHSLFESGNPRMASETRATIRRQLETACLGVQDAVDQIQTEMGVKDEIASYWIPILIDKAKTMQKERFGSDVRLDKLKSDNRKDMKNQIKNEIQNELFEWLVSQTPGSVSITNDVVRSASDDIPQVQVNVGLDIQPGHHYSPLLDLKDLDPHRDTPCEILHTILLGINKYLWHETSKIWDKKKEEIFAQRLRSSSIDGLSIPALRAQYMVQYKNSLVGKHLKSLRQIGVFHLHNGLCSQEIFDLWKATGDLGALLWFPEIRDLDAYLEDLQILVNNVLDRWAIFDPSRIQYKYKLHILSHLKDDIR
ncbi:hypothetical protein CVT24_007640 [Panaeolus cyanescens]|uniref:Uncharacterized protein n=1 Tax=Panaeolus cyanescens TaxID=181874 RepID=A0A409WZ54_9AGAR|nr:hypothetical protein CVT24_007640 [Panaeolus cyanescens]